MDYVGRSGFGRAIDLFDHYSDERLSFTDATILAHVESRNVDYVRTFDEDFDGIVDRLDPEALAR